MRQIIIALALVVAFAMPARADTITIRADVWCPYNCAPDNKKPGYAIEIVKTVFENAGHKIDYGILNWADSIARTRKGEFTAIIGATNHDAPDFIFPNETIGMSSITYAVRQANKSIIHSVDDLKGKVLGIIDAYSYNPAVDAYIASFKSDPQKIHMSAGDDALETNTDLLLN
ncbi:MAG: transporter substrate-binding domain-containing protein, partial [Alphaproteobacteria bacterium]|nr:transporter substrate-binding domain-containing protein [Alphaproteobacteria bacterium]